MVALQWYGREIEVWVCVSVCVSMCGRGIKKDNKNDCEKNVEHQGKNHTEEEVWVKQIMTLFKYSKTQVLQWMLLGGLWTVTKPSLIRITQQRALQQAAKNGQMSSVRKCKNLCVITWVSPASLLSQLPGCYHQTFTEMKRCSDFLLTGLLEIPEPNNAAERRAYMLFMAGIHLLDWSGSVIIYWRKDWSAGCHTLSTPVQFFALFVTFQDGSRCLPACTSLPPSPSLRNLILACGDTAVRTNT